MSCLASEGMTLDKHTITSNWEILITHSFPKIVIDMLRME